MTEAKGGTELMYEELKTRLPHVVNDLDIINAKFEGFDETKNFHVMWCHDLAQDPRFDFMEDKEIVERMDYFVFVSNWQANQFISYRKIPYTKVKVIKNAINPVEPHTKEKGDKIKFIYTSTPHRGLDILFRAVEHLCTYRTDFEVDVFSSFKIYGDAWSKAQEDAEPFFEKLSDHPQVNYHGTVSNTEVKEALKKAHVFAYPSIYVETYCLAMVEAMSAGCLCITPNTGALPEIGSEWNWMYEWVDDKELHATIMATQMYHAIDYFWHPGTQKKLEFQSKFVDLCHSWDYRQSAWENLWQEWKNDEDSEHISGSV